MTPRNSHSRTQPDERDWRPFKWLIIGMAVMAIVLSIPTKGSPYSVKLTHRVDVKVRETQACRPWIGAPRFPVRRTYARQSSKFRRWALELWTRRAREACGLMRRLNADPARAVAYVFERVGQADKALSVVRCESNFWPYARNGQYLGLFQMGSYARGRYGHSWTPLGQAWSALAYWRDAGWGPWACA